MMKRRVVLALVPLAALLGPFCRPADAAPMCAWGKLVSINVCIGK
jgi:hypothetical protein